MKFRYLFYFLLCSAVLPLHAKINVVATTADLGSIAEEVGGKNVKVIVLARPTEDPHFVDAKPSFFVKLSRADLLIEGGAELEIGWLPPLIDGARNPRIAVGAKGHLKASQGIQLLEVPATLNRAQGDIHAMGNPHFIIDPVNAMLISRNIAGRYAELDPKNAAKYHKNQADFAARLEAKTKEWQKMLAPFKGRHVAAFHDSWPYFSQRFGLVIDIFLEPKPGIPPTPSHLAEVIEQMKAENVKAILCEAYQNRKTAEKVAADTGAEVLDVSQFPGAIKGVKDDYISLLDYIIGSLAKALGK
jgi:zinc/manganese transport system substrate-binding protein